MTRRDRLAVSFAVLFSVLLHALVAYAVIDLPIESAGEAIFQPEPRTRVEPTRVFRSAEDKIVQDEPADGRRPTPDESQPEEEAPRRTGERLLEDLEAADLPADPENTPPPEVDPDQPTPSPAAPRPAPAPAPAPARMVDATRRLLRQADPDLALPRFTGPDDSAAATPPMDSPVDPAGRIDPARLGRLGGVIGGGAPSSGQAPLEGLVDESAGTGAGRSAGPGAAPPVSRPPTPAPPAKPTDSSPPSAARPPLPLPTASEAPAAMSGETKPPIHLDKDFSYTLLTRERYPHDEGFLGLFGGVRVPENEPGWFEARITPQRSLRRLTPLKKDVVWVIDTSSSLSSQWIRQVKRGVRTSLDTLNEGDRFNVVAFQDRVRVLSENGLVEAGPDRSRRVGDFLESARRGGYTDVNRALGRLIVRRVPPDRVYQIILITDGRPTRGAIDPRKIINMITRENGRVASIYGVGVGGRPDRKLLEFLAYRNKGLVVYPDDARAAAGEIRELAGRLRYPLLKDVSFSALGVDADTIYPRLPRDIYQGETFSLYGRYTRAARRLSMRLSGTSGGRTLDFTFTLPFDGARRGEPKIARRWGFWKLHHLYSEMIRLGRTDPLRKRVEYLRRRYGLETAF